MEVHIRNAHGDLPAAMKEHAEQRLNKLERYFNKILRAEIVYEEMRGRHNVELQLNADGYNIRGTGENGNARAALDNAINHVESRLLKFKKRISDRHHKRGLGHLPMATLPDEEAEAGANGFEPQITKHKRFTMKPCTAEEAALQMELLSRDYYVFNNEETNQICLLYRLPNGNYCLSEPEV